MNGWFTVEPLDADTWAIGEYRHWEETHCYLLNGDRRSLLIDTGLGIRDISEITAALTDKPVTAAATHIHWDHIGGLSCFAHTAVHGAEAGWVSGQFPLPPQIVRANLTARPCRFPEGFFPEDYRVYSDGAGERLRDGEIIDLVGRQVQVLHTPGHSPGHCCFYEAARGFLFVGDLLYAGCLDAFYPTTDPRQFARSVERICHLPVAWILPGHHRMDLPPDFAARVNAAWQHLERQGLLRQGSGIFSFDGFQIHL